MGTYNGKTRSRKSSDSESLKLSNELMAELDAMAEESRPTITWTDDLIAVLTKYYPISSTSCTLEIMKKAFPHLEWNMEKVKSKANSLGLKKNYT